MAKFTVKLETVTPLFLGGANPRGTPELRPPAFRGAMRYWLRALLGGKLGDSKDALKEIKKIEGSVFGSPGEENDNSASSMIIRISNSELGRPESFRKEGSRSKPTGADYLYWSMDATKQDEKSVPARKYIPEGSSFDLVLNTRFGVQSSENILKYASASLWVLLHLGGIGARSHHLAGNLAVISPNELYSLNFKTEIGTHAQVAEQISNKISSIRNSVLLNEIGLSQGDKSEFDILHPRFCKIWLLGIWENSVSAVNVVGKRYHEFRTKRPESYDASNWLWERSAFGLPIQGISGVERRTSPLWLSIVPVGIEGHCAVIATLFKSRLVENGVKLNIETTHRERLRDKEPPKDFSLIEKWVTDKFSKRVEVML